MSNKSFWLRLAAVLASGLGCAALVPPWDLGFLAWVSIAPLLAAVWSLTGRHAGWKGFALGWLTGAITHGFQLSWLSVVSPLGAGVLPAYLGLFWGAFGAFAATWGRPERFAPGKPLVVALVTASMWAFLEWLRGWLFTGFGWNGLGVGLHGNPVFAQAADILGIAGLSLFLVFLQALLVQGIRQRTKRVLIPITAAILLAGSYGKIRIRTEKDRAHIPLHALLVQNNIPQDAARYLWDPAEIHMAYEDATLEALKNAKTAGTFPDWVIWPESALTGRILRTDDGGWGTWQENIDTLQNVREGGDFTLMFGAVELEAESEDDALVAKPGGNTYNSLVAMSPEDALQTFRKHHLVIFGETIPFVDSIPFLKRIYQQQAGVEYGGSFTSGKSFEPLPAKTASGAQIGIIPTVCFEDTVPRLTRRFLKNGPQVIVNVTNDGWFKESPAAAQHFANAKFRSIELRRPMLRAANTGITAHVDTTGHAVILKDRHENHFISGTLFASVAVPTSPAVTLYNLIGDWGIILCGGAGLALSFYLRRPVTEASKTQEVTL